MEKKVLYILKFNDGKYGHTRWLTESQAEDLNKDILNAQYVKK